MAVSRQSDHWPGYQRRYPSLYAGHFKLARDCQRHCRGSSCFKHIFPLCGNGMAFHWDFDGAFTTLGVSRLLYNRDLLIYDQKSKFLWSQIMGQAVSGPRKGELLVSVPSNIQHKRTRKNNIHRQKFSPATPVSDAIMNALPMVTMTKMETFFTAVFPL